MECKYSLLFVMYCLFSSSTFAQVKPEQFKPFIGNQEIIGSSGPGLTSASGDILLELSDVENPDVETVMLIRNSNGKLSKIAENADLLMGQEILGISGGNYPGLSGNTLSIDYTIGSNSSQSDISIVFEKSGDGNYYFKEYTSKTRNYGVEHLFARARITSQQTGKINLSEASESEILQKSKVNMLPDEPDYEAAQQYAASIPDGWRLVTFAKGDLNLDGLKKDLLLLLYNEESYKIRLLMQQKGDSYKTAQENDALIVPDETFNINNLKAVVKNGYFTVEQRVAIDDNDFDHRYITFKYDTAQKNWLLHRFDVEHYAGFNPKPAADVLHLTKNEFGTVPFQRMNNLPGMYEYEPVLSVVSGTLVKKQFYGRPNYGETPEKDEKIWVYILKPNYPVSVVAPADQPGPETADKTVTGISEIQVYSTVPHVDFKNWENKKVTLLGVFQAAQTAHQYTNVLLEVKQIL